MCSAISGFAKPMSEAWREFAIERARLAPSRMHATLVLEREPSDFSTDAGNSALIVTTKSPRALLRQFRDNEISNLTTIGSPGRERHVTDEAFSTTIRCCYRTVIRGADHCALYSRRARSRHTDNGLLGSLGARSQQGLYRSGQ